jgi:hypothetical protein
MFDYFKVPFCGECLGTFRPGDHILFEVRETGVMGLRALPVHQRCAAEKMARVEEDKMLAHPNLPASTIDKE